VHQSSWWRAGKPVKRWLRPISSKLRRVEPEAANFDVFVVQWRGRTGRTPIAAGGQWLRA